MIQKEVVFDLETIADRSMLELLPPVEADNRLKDPVKIEANIKEKEQKRLGELSVDPLTNMVCCFAYFDIQEARYDSIMLEEESGEAEKELLAKAWSVLSRYNRYVTFNGNNFDVRVLNLHSLKQRIRPSVKIDIRKYQIGNHVDLRAVLTNWETYAKGTLDFFMKMFFGDGEGKAENMDGSWVQHYWDVGMRDDIKAYGEKDVIDTGRLYALVREYYLPNV